jgi:hypothetical protein
MKENFWEHLLGCGELYYYTGFIWTLCSLIALITGIKYYKKEKKYTLLIAYCIASILLSQVFMDTILFWTIQFGLYKKNFSFIMNSSFAIIEFSTFCYFFIEIRLIKRRPYIINLLWIFYILLCLFFIFRVVFTDSTRIQRTLYLDIITSIEFIIFLLFCFMHFFQLLTNDSIRVKSKLADEPSFWIASGLFFYSIVSLPLMLTSNELLIYRELQHIMYSIHYISISILLICIAKAFSCKTPLTA